MDTVTIPLAAINPQLLQTIQDLCFCLVGEQPKTQAYYERRDELFAAIEGKVERLTSNDAHDLYLNLATHMGAEMFRLGLAIGRNPEIMFDLPDRPNALGS
jgi:hypothetical protein